MVQAGSRPRIFIKGSKKSQAGKWWLWDWNTRSHTDLESPWTLLWRESLYQGDLITCIYTYFYFSKCTIPYNTETFWWRGLSWPLRLRKSAPVQTSWTKIARRLNWIRRSVQMWNSFLFSMCLSIMFEFCCSQRIIEEPWVFCWCTMSRTSHLSIVNSLTILL